MQLVEQAKMFRRLILARLGNSLSDTNSRKRQ
jgi:hypothetical protein